MPRSVDNRRLRTHRDHGALTCTALYVPSARACHALRHYISISTSSRAFDFPRLLASRADAIILY
ncbi:hypothetical protein WOLCODRAFT_29519 [Wolfiporia cocos MD-104 SS10]|uniref:Uncharacterized protein n=1 Tax=Wolfiporia cocos (strain MD-104) TaxID=742152 RepID=A0A2H3JAW5_WOLCO|nr:hypothetical protein WOLCODRAFT_29519 [Wolfiporia cocos MD-104 SS10]